MRWRAQFLTLILAALFVVACRTSANESEAGQGLGNEIAVTRPDPVVRGTEDCRTAKQPHLRRVCGTTNVELEYASEVGMSRLTRIGFGERAAEVSDHISAANRHLANIRAARPELVARLLGHAVTDIRSRTLRMCELEGHSRPPGLTLRTDFFGTLLWVQYRLSLIEGDAEKFVREVDTLLTDPCFREEQSLYFGTRPAAFLSPGDHVYTLTSSFAASLGYYHRRKGERLVSDAYTFRAEIGKAGDTKSACFARVFETQRSGLSSIKGKLWDRCLQLIATGKSCMALQKQCTS